MYNGVVAQAANIDKKHDAYFFLPRASPRDTVIVV